MKIHILRVVNGFTKTWIVFDATRVIHGKANETQKDVIARWAAAHGKPTAAVRYRGLCRPSEAAMTIASVQKGDDR